MKYLVAATVVAMMCSAEPGMSKTSLPSFEFRTHHIGEPIDTNFPYWSQGYRGLNSPSCSKQSTGAVDCNDSTIIRKEQYGTQNYVGDVPVMAVNYNFWQGHLYGMEMFFYTAWHSKIRDMLVGKYGKPSAEKLDKVQNRAGATFDNVVTEWSFQEGTLKLEQRFGQIDTGLLQFENPIINHEIYSQKSETDQAEGRTAF